MHLHQVEPVGAALAQALLDTRPDVPGAVVVRKRRRGAGRRITQQAAALGRQEVLVAAMAEILPDEFLAPAVVDRGVDQADAPVEDRAEKPARLLVLNPRSPGLAAQLHGPVPQDGHVRSVAKELRSEE